MPLDGARAAQEIERELVAAGTPERAAGEKRYLKSSLEHLGATHGANRSVVHAFARNHPRLRHDELIAVVRALWARPVFDTRLAGALLLEVELELLGPDDLPLLLELVRDSHTWALVDQLAADVIGRLLMRHPEAGRRLDPWALDGDFWVRRSALLSNLPALSRGTGFARFARYADGMLEEREFFIRKAIGWGLREAGKRLPDEVYGWLEPRISRASGVTVREAVKYLDPQRRAHLLAAYRARA